MWGWWHEKATPKQVESTAVARLHRVEYTHELHRMVSCMHLTHVITPGDCGIYTLLLWFLSLQCTYILILVYVHAQ